MWCRYDPSKRPSAAEALHMPYFSEEPPPADARTMAAFMRACMDAQSR